MFQQKGTASEASGKSCFQFLKIHPFSKQEVSLQPWIPKIIKKIDSATRLWTIGIVVCGWYVYEQMQCICVLYFCILWFVFCTSHLYGYRYRKWSEKFIQLPPDKTWNLASVWHRVELSHWSCQKITPQNSQYVLIAPQNSQYNQYVLIAPQIVNIINMYQ